MNDNDTVATNNVSLTEAMANKIIFLCERIKEMEQEIEHLQEQLKFYMNTCYEQGHKIKSYHTMYGDVLDDLSEVE